MSDPATPLAERLADRVARVPPGADWLAPLRHAGAEAFRRHGLPDRRVEAWKYTPVRLLEAGGDATGRPAPFELAADAVVDMASGEVSGGLSAGTRLERLVDADDEALRALLGELTLSGPAQAFAALNTATLEHGLVARVTAGADAGRLLLDWSGCTTDWADARVCLLLDEGAKLTLVERYGAVSGALNTVFQVRLGSGARLDHVRVQDAGPAAALITRTEVEQLGDSRYAYTGLDLGGRVVRHDVEARLAAPGAACRLDGAYLPRGASHVDNHLAVEHRAPDCASEQFFRGVVDDRARAVFNGRVHVLPGADGTEAHQSNANLLLSEYAEVDTKPELEIEADEVVASHGATVGQLDETALFYLRSRGLSEAEARQLLTGAFCRAVLDRLEPGAVRDALESRLQAALESAP